MKKLLMIIWLVWWGCTLSSAFAYTYPSQPASLPAYQFQSTSTCPSVIGASPFVSDAVYAPYSGTPASKPRKVGEYNPWDEDGDGSLDEGDPTGQELGQVDTPIGEPLILIAFAFLYLLYRRRKKISAL